MAPLNDREVAKDFLNKVNIEVDSLTQMVNELIELSRIETGRAKLQSGAGKSQPVIEEVVNHLTPQAERKQVYLTDGFDS